MTRKIDDVYRGVSTLQLHLTVCSTQLFPAIREMKTHLFSVLCSQNFNTQIEVRQSRWTVTLSSVRAKPRIKKDKNSSANIWDRGEGERRSEGDFGQVCVASWIDQMLWLEATREIFMRMRLFRARHKAARRARISLKGKTALMIHKRNTRRAWKRDH